MVKQICAILYIPLKNFYKEENKKINFFNLLTINKVYVVHEELEICMEA